MILKKCLFECLVSQGNEIFFESELSKTIAPNYNLKIETFMKLKDREELKTNASQLLNMGFNDGSQMLIDISHWFRYLEKNISKPKDFFDYLQWKYTNHEGSDNQGISY